MHILIIPSEDFSPKGNPMAGIFQLDQAKILTSKGCKVGVITIRLRHTYWSLLRTFIGVNLNNSLSKYEAFKLILSNLIRPNRVNVTLSNRYNIQVYNVLGFWGFKRAKNKKSCNDLWLKYGLSSYDSYIKYNGKPDIIHSHNMVYGGILGHHISKKHQIPLIITEHSSAFAREEIKNQFLLKSIKEVYQFNHSFTAVSPALSNLLGKYFSPKNKINTLPNVMDPIFEQKLDTEAKQTLPFIFLSIGNLIPLKGHKELIGAFNRAFSNDYEVELQIAGSGYLEKELNDLIEELNLVGRVRLLGELNREEVKIKIDNSNVFLLPSHYETFGVVLIEALSRGVPVISTICGGPESIVNRNNGLLVEPKEEDSLAEAMMKMKEGYNQYSSSEIRKMAIDKFGSKAFYKRVMNLYNNTINDYSN